MKRREIVLHRFCLRLKDVKIIFKNIVCIKPSLYLPVVYTNEEIKHHLVNVLT